MSYFHADRAALDAERALYPHVCPVCGLPRTTTEVCAHHVEAVAMTTESGEGYAEDWAAGNRAFCAWAHRNRRDA